MKKKIEDVLYWNPSETELFIQAKDQPHGKLGAIHYDEFNEMWFCVIHLPATDFYTHKKSLDGAKGWIMEKAVEWFHNLGIEEAEAEEDDRECKGSCCNVPNK